MIESVFEKLLHDLDQQGLAEMPEEWEDEVSDRLESLRDAYANLTDVGRPEIDYSDLATQAAYLFVYAIGRAEFTYELLKRHRAELGEPLFPNSTVRITSLGGGPGSEIAGVVKYLLDPSNGEKVTSIKYWVFDKNDHWADVCETLVDELTNMMQIDLSYEKLDLCNKDQCEQISLEGDDLLILSFVISELCAITRRNDAEVNLRGLYKTLDTGAKIFYNDSNATSFYYYFNETRRFVKGLGKISQKSEIVEKFTIKLSFGDTYNEYIEQFDVTPHMTSDALSKLLVRSIP